MRVKKKLNLDNVERIKGKSSEMLTDRCPDRRVVFPSLPCTNIGCDYAINKPGYMNCTFVAAEAGGEHTLEAIAEMMDLTREGVRLIELRALRKAREQMNQLRNHAESTLREQGLAARPDRHAPLDEGAESEDEADHVSALHG